MLKKRTPQNDGGGKIMMRSGAKPPPFDIDVVVSVVNKGSVRETSAAPIEPRVL